MTIDIIEAIAVTKSTLGEPSTVGNLPKIHLLFGFLGSGKTTLVKKLLQTSNSNIPTAVVVNEFGDVGIDGEIIQGKSIDTVELVSGCICCTLRGSLLNAIEELAYEKGARRIIVESTGIADPEDMLDDLEEPEIVDKFDVAPIVTVVDSSKFRKIQPMLGEFYESQIYHADILIVNKIDLSTEQDIDAVITHVLANNPAAEVHYTEHCDVESNFIYNQTPKHPIDSHSHHHQHDHHSHDEHEHHHNHNGEEHEHHHHTHDSMHSFVIVPREDLSVSELENYCRSLPDTVWRMKGHLKLDGQTSLVQYSAGQLDISPSEAREHYRMVVIGEELNVDQLSRELGIPLASTLA